MEIRLKKDSVEISGYVNAVERNSKPLMSRIGQFIERICKGAFSKAIKRNDDIHILLNHDWNRDLGSTKEGNLELTEDNIGLFARAILTDEDIIKKARNGDLVGWSFGFQDRDVINSIEKGIPTREVKDLDLYEVSILDKTKTPAYDGTLISARSENDEIHFKGEDYLDEIKYQDSEEKPLEYENNNNGDNPEVEKRDDPKQQEIVDNIKTPNEEYYTSLREEINKMEEI